MVILILLLLIAINGIFAASEIALVSSRRIRLEQAAARGRASARVALRLAEQPSRFLSTVQIGITLIGVVAGAFGQAAIAEDLAPLFARSPILQPYADLVATIIVVLGITYLSLVIGELVPKRLAMHHPERAAMLVAPWLQWLATAARPFVWLLSRSTDLIVALTGSKPAAELQVTAEDIRHMIEEGTARGVFHEQERELVERVFRLGEQQVSALMVPRTEIDWLESDATAARVRVAVATSSHSHFPVCKGGIDNLVGVVHLKDMVKSGLLTQSIDLKVLARKPLFVPESMPAVRLLEAFSRADVRIAFVLDEYGVTAGLITLTDIAGSVLGPIVHGGEEHGPMAVRRDDGSWLLDGGLTVQDLKGLMEVDSLPHEDRTSFHTLAGFVLTHLGRVPRTGESFSYGRFRFEVVDMDRHRIDKVILTFTAPREHERMFEESAE